MSQDNSKDYLENQDNNIILNAEIMENLVKEKKYNKLVKKVEEYKNNFREYKKLKWKGIIYKYNESIRVTQDNNIKIGIIKRIISIKSFTDQSELPLLQIGWFIQKNELDSQWEKYINSFSDYELFLSDLWDYIFIGQIIEKIKVVNVEQYDQMIADDNTNKLFFSRCTYNYEKQQLNPHPDQLEKVCFCEVPQNPDLIYIFCEKCKRWLHMDCVHLTEEEAKNIDEYICIKCLQ